MLKEGFNGEIEIGESMAAQSVSLAFSLVKVTP
jgi:hypothetical protein